MGEGILKRVQYKSTHIQEIVDGAVAHFLHQNGLGQIDKSDSSGWWPLHYAALSGNTEVIRGLLQLKASVNQRTSRDDPSLGIPLWASALLLAVTYRHHDAVQLLITARADPDGGTFPAMLFAAVSDDADSIRMLCAAGGNPLAKEIYGNSALCGAAGYHAAQALEELVAQAQPGPTELGKGLHFAASFRGGSADMVQRLIYLRADVDFQHDMNRDLSRVGWLLFTAKSLQHRFGKVTTLSTWAYHVHGSTPLMQAMRSAQYEAAAALIASGAKLEIRNCRGWTAADFAVGQSIPAFLLKGLGGDPSECKWVTSLALADDLIKETF